MPDAEEQQQRFADEVRERRVLLVKPGDILLIGNIGRDTVTPEQLIRPADRMREIGIETFWFSEDIDIDVVAGGKQEPKPVDHIAAAGDCAPEWVDPTHGRIDRDIQEKVEEMKPSNIGQRVAMENTLQNRRGVRKVCLHDQCKQYGEMVSASHVHQLRYHTGD